MMSAVKVDGAKLYERARRGETVRREPRPVTVVRFDITGFEAGAFPEVAFEVECGKGTYIRSLVESVGERLGCGAHLAKLRRTANGAYSVGEAFTLEQLEAEPERLDRAAIPIDEIRTGLPELEPEDAAVRRVGFGAALTEDDSSRLAEFDRDSCIEIRRAGRLLAIYRVARATGGTRATPECVLVPAGEGDPP
jgi:tRNA pseudouridine55 synthase